MHTSRNISLREPEGSERIPEATLAYFRMRNQHRLYSLVIGEFKRSGITQADLARRLGKGADIVCRWLRSPGNWTADTASDLLFASSGAEPRYSVGYPLTAAAGMSTRSSTIVISYGANTTGMSAILSQPLAKEIDAPAGEALFRPEIEINMEDGPTQVVAEAYWKAAA
jgi:hypothetical protein